MSPYPPDPVNATGPVRIVICSFPNDAEAERVSRDVLERRHAACSQRVPIRSAYWWRGRIESAEECLVLYKTSPKQVGALFRRLAELHPYDVPEIVELDVPRVASGYLTYLFEAVGEARPPTPIDGEVPTPARPGSRRARGARPPRGTRAPRRRR